MNKHSFLNEEVTNWAGLEVPAQYAYMIFK